MDKSSPQLGVAPLSKVNPLTMVASVGSPAHNLDEQASMLAKQQASLTAKLTETKLDQAAKKTTATADVSATAKLINEIVKQAEANGISHRYIASNIITQQPKLTHLVPDQLKAAISQSGLFYESHLREFAEGQRQASSIRQEPQNQSPQSAQSLLPQQLHILENQRLSWHGEVWPNQLMDWDIYLKNAKDEHDGPVNVDDEDKAVASDLTLHLPLLGKVTATINVENGQMRIALLAEQTDALQLLKDKSPALVKAIESHGTVLQGLTLDAFDEEELA